MLSVNALGLAQFSMFLISSVVIVLSPLVFWIQVREKSAAVRETVFSVVSISLFILAALVMFIVITNQ